MKRFLFLLIASVLCFASGCAYLQYRNVLHVSLEGAVGTVNGVEQTIEEGYLNITRDIKNDTWLLSLWFPYDFPFSNQVIYTTEDKAECVNSSYRFTMEDEDGKTSYLIVDAGCYEEGVILIQSQLRWGDSLELRLRDSDNKQIMTIRSRFMKYIFPTYRPSESAMSFIKAADSPSCSPLDTMAVAEDTATIEWDEMVEYEEIPEYYYRSPKAEDNNMEESVHQEEDRELYIGPYTASNSGIVRKFTIYEKWMLEHFNVAVDHPKKYDYKGTATYEGKSYRYYEYDDDNYILVSPDTDNLVMFWLSSFDGKVSHNISRYAKGDNSSPSSAAPPVDMGNSYQQQQYYQQQQKQQRAQMYLSQYRTWENTVISNYNTLMTMREGAARTSVRMNFRNAQSQMRQIRQNAQMEGISFTASAWESASVPLGYE